MSTVKNQPKTAAMTGPVRIASPGYKARYRNGTANAQSSDPAPDKPQPSRDRAVLTDLLCDRMLSTGGSLGDTAERR
jgi:hypothetical protein